MIWYWFSPCVKWNIETSSQAPSYASSKLRPTDILTGVKCRATGVAKKSIKCKKYMGTWNISFICELYHVCVVFGCFQKNIINIWMSLPRLPMIIQIFTLYIYVSNLFCFSLKQFHFSSQALNMEGNFLNQMKPSQIVIKETPRKRLRVPPISATMVDEWYSSSSFSIEMYLVRVYLN